MKTAQGLVKKIRIVILIAFLSVLGIFILLETLSAKREKEDKLIISSLGRQKMYTQMIAKDSSSLYALLNDLEDGGISMTTPEVKSKYEEYIDSLQKAKDDFTQTLTELEKGYLKVESKLIDLKSSDEKLEPYLMDLKLLWDEFGGFVQIMTEAEAVNEEVLAAATFINLNNLKLLDLCDQIQQIILTDSIASTRQMTIIFYATIGILSILLIANLIYLIKFIILPFNRLHKGLAEIGLENDQIRAGYANNRKTMPVLDEVNNMFLKINYLINLIENMNSHSSFTDSLNYINETFSRFIPYNYIGVALLDDKKKKLKASYGVSDGKVTMMSEKFHGLTCRLAETSLGRLIETGEARVINDLEEYTAGRPLKYYNKLILDAGIRSSITLPLKVADNPVGIIFFSSVQKNVYKEEHVNFLKTLVNSIAISFSQNIFINDLVFSTILALAKLAEARDEDTGEHLERMKKYARLIAELLFENDIYPGEITPEYFDQIERFSPLHDIGKVGVRDSILLKPGRLTREEYEEMKLHTLYGASVLRAAEENIAKRGRHIFALGIEIAEGHHEKWDGSGYPYGKNGLEIPLSARIVAVADVFDALTSRRPYKEAYTFEASMRIIEEGKGTHFDPKIAEVFLANHDRVKKMYEEFKMMDREDLVS